MGSIQISKKSLEILKERVAKLGFSQGLKKIFFGTLEDNIDKIRSSFDYVVCYNFLHHVSDIEETIDLMREATKPGEILFLLNQTDSIRFGVFIDLNLSSNGSMKKVYLIAPRGILRIF